MKRVLLTVAALSLLGGACGVALSSPEEDRQDFRDYYLKRFPNVPVGEFINGVYAIDPVSRENWEAIEEFAPYEPFIDDGEEMWAAPFKNGKSYQDCFPDGPGIADQYPRWDKAQGQVVTLALALNQCRESHGEKALKYKKGKIASLLAYLAFESRGKITNVAVPDDDPRALAAYQQGKKFYYTRRGQLNFACATCHLLNPGMNLRADVLSPAFGHTTGWPVYRRMTNS